MEFRCEICGKEMSMESWLIARKCIPCLEKKIKEIEEIIEEREMKKSGKLYEKENP